MPTDRGITPASESKRTLTSDELLAIYELMVLAQKLDERTWALNRQGKVPIVVSARGHEACQIASALALNRSQDLFFTYYRDVAVMLALGFSPSELLLSYLGKAGGAMSNGRQFPLMGADLRRRVINTSNVVAAQLTHAVGAALAFRMRKEPAVAIVYFGDGATSQGEWHEAVNFASIHKLPVVFFCENNGYAISTPLRRQMAIPRVADRGAAYGIPSVTVDGTDVTATFLRTAEAAERARSGSGPALVEAIVPRLRPHTTDDDERLYRSAAELALAQEKDPLPRLHQELERLGVLSAAAATGIEARCAAQVEQATTEAERAPYPASTSLREQVYAPRRDR